MLIEAAKKIFHETLLRIDAREAVKRAVEVRGSRLAICKSMFELDPAKPNIYVVAMGKAAYPMAVAFNETAGASIKRGVVSGAGTNGETPQFGPNWELFAGGHPLPNEESLAAGRASFAMLNDANTPDSIVVFLVSGGGSAMMDVPCGDISLDDLRSLNRTLVTCGASISEINAVRRAVSKIKGGGLATRANRAKQISLIISDTSAGDTSSVASGPSMLPSLGLPNAKGIIGKYKLDLRLPRTVLSAIEQSAEQELSDVDLDSSVYVLFDNEFMLRNAAEIAGDMGFTVVIDSTAGDSNIDKGCGILISQLLELRASEAADRPVCLISGGEFACKVVGNGIGGRNSETVLRLAMLAENERSLMQWAVLSAGTDGIDGNSPAAGSAADETLLDRAAAAGLDAITYLEASDSFNFFSRMDSTIITGPTGTNVRDIRILMAN